MKLTTSFQRIFFFILLGLILVGAWRLVSAYWQLILLAAIVAFFLRPAYTWLSNHSQLKPAVITALIYIVLLFAVLLPFIGGLLIIGNQAAQLAAVLATFDGADFGELFATFSHWVRQWLGLDLQALLDQLLQLIADNLGSIATAIAESVAGLVGSVLSVLVSFFLFSFFFVVMLPNWHRLRIFLIKLTPFEPTLTELYLRQVGLMTRDVMLGTFGVALVQTLVMWVVLALVGVPFAGLLSVFVFVFALIPLLGISLVTIPLGIILILLGQWLPALIIWVVHFLVINNVDLILRPLITSKELRAHPALVIVGFIGGLFAFGLVGLFIGPILIILLATSLEVYIENYGHPSFNET